MVKKYWNKKQSEELHNDCDKYNIPVVVADEISRIINVLDINYGSDRNVETDYGGCVYLIISNEKDEYKKILDRYKIDESDYEYKDVLYDSECRWISALYITSTEYSVTIIMKIQKASS